MSPLPSHPSVVGVATHPSILLDHDLRQDCDVVECRIDLFPDRQRHPGALELELPPDVPLIITCRAPEEGGSGPPEAGRREELLLPWLGVASAIDVELASVALMPDLLAGARSSKTSLIGSFHDFHDTPADALLLEQIASASSLKLDVAKLATFAHNGNDLLRLAALLTDPPTGSPALAIMAMGPLAALSRTLLGSLGSLLNYGYLGDQPVAPGQISSRLLRDTLRLLAPAGQI